MATQSGSVFELDVLADFAFVNAARQSIGYLTSVRSGAASEFDLWTSAKYLNESDSGKPIRRSPGDIGYASIPVVSPFSGIVACLGVEYMMFGPGDNYHDEFTLIRSDTGIGSDADSTPVATVTCNGTDTALMPVTVTKLSTGRYALSGIIPTAWRRRDVIQISVSCTVNGKTFAGIVSSFVLTGLVTTGQVWP
jgi:hypothetical protein